MDNIIGKSEKMQDELISAIKKSDFEGVKKAVYNGADVNQKDSSEETPMHHASHINADINIVEFLVAKGASLDTLNEFYETPLHYIIRDNLNPEIMKKYIELGADTKIEHIDGWGLLHYAAAHSTGPICEALIEHGLQVNEKTGYSGEEPLHIASRKGNDEAALTLLEHGADIEAKNKLGQTPLITNIFESDDFEYFFTEVLEVLLENKANVNEKFQGISPIIHCAEAHHAESFKLLADYGANINDRNDIGESIREITSNSEIIDHLNKIESKILKEDIVDHIKKKEMKTKESLRL